MLNIKLVKRFFFFWATLVFKPWKILQTDFMTVPTKLLLVNFVKFSIWGIFSHTLGLSQAFLFSLNDSTTSTKRNGENYTISLTKRPSFFSISSHALHHHSATLKQEVKAQVDSPFAPTTELLRPLNLQSAHSQRKLRTKLTLKLEFFIILSHWECTGTTGYQAVLVQA